MFEHYLALLHLQIPFCFLFSRRNDLVFAILDQVIDRSNGIWNNSALLNMQRNIQTLPFKLVGSSVAISQCSMRVAKSIFKPTAVGTPNTRLLIKCCPGLSSLWKKRKSASGAMNFTNSSSLISNKCLTKTNNVQTITFISNCTPCFAKVSPLVGANHCVCIIVAANDGAQTLQYNA